MPSRRSVLVGSSIGLISTVAGCLGDADSEGNGGDDDNGDTNDSNDDDDSNSTNLFQEDASTYLLSAEDLSVELEEQQVRGPEMNPAGLESAQVIEFLSPDEEDEVNLAVAVFDSIDSASTYLEDQQNNFDSTNDETIGDEAFSASVFGESVVEARISNVSVQCLGTLHISNLRQITEEQIDSISD